ncbi:hypothetical protein Ldro_2166 [Legionella drozanskii LLAP-1]|uniref:Uncharacterized protein n=2 Tax=Legionellaceae TaxID=444 RepID=A0A0W0SRG1_9GAMM|nr:hypothetical protein Ldro_2166 [Legionella drozanskii LLAP-1]PJE10883.1 MAG: hypothetical protein CK430_09490 [Legionella sp.]
MPKLHKKKTSVKIKEEHLQNSDRHLWIEALKQAQLPKLIFKHCQLEALPLSRLFFELRNKYEAIEFIDCTIVSTDINNSMQLLLAKIANMLKQTNPIEFTVIDTQQHYDLKKLPWDALIDNLMNTNSSLVLNVLDLEGHPVHLEIKTIKWRELIGEKESHQELVIPLLDAPPLLISFSEQEEKLIVKQGKSSYKKSEDEDSIEKSAINSRIIFSYLTQVACLAKTQNLSLEINTNLDSFNEFVYIYDAKSGRGDCNASLHNDYGGGYGKSIQEAALAERLPKLLSNLPRVTRLEVFNLNSRLLSEVEFANSLSTSAFDALETMEIIGNAETQESKAQFFKALKGMEHLQELELLGQVLLEADMADIAYLLMCKEKLQKVTLGGANLTNRAIKCLAHELSSLRKAKHVKELKKLNLSNNSRLDEEGYTQAALKDFLKILKLLRPQEVGHDFAPSKKIDALLRPKTEKEESLYSKREEFSGREKEESYGTTEELSYSTKEELSARKTEETSYTGNEEPSGVEFSFSHPVFGNHLMRVKSDTESSTTGDESGYSPRPEIQGEVEYLSRVAIFRTESQVELTKKRVTEKEYAKENATIPGRMLYRSQDFPSLKGSSNRNATTSRFSCNVNPVRLKKNPKVESETDDPIIKID